MTGNSFNCGGDYDADLNRGLVLSGEEKAYFATGRIIDLVGQLPDDFSARRVLDFGCGVGGGIPPLRRAFPEAVVVGVDPVEAALDVARRRCGSAGVQLVRGLAKQDRFDLCYVNGVFHHLHGRERPRALAEIFAHLRPGGFLGLFENNPLNLGTRWVMHRIPFDRTAEVVTPWAMRQLVSDAGFLVCALRYLFFFPRWLRMLRPLESRLASLPLGAQYGVVARRP